jgi:hypothetical protein
VPIGEADQARVVAFVIPFSIRCGVLPVHVLSVSSDGMGRFKRCLERKMRKPCQALFSRGIAFRKCLMVRRQTRFAKSAFDKMVFLRGEMP